MCSLIGTCVLPQSHATTVSCLCIATVHVLIHLAVHSSSVEPFVVSHWHCLCRIRVHSARSKEHRVIAYLLLCVVKDVDSLRCSTAACYCAVLHTQPRGQRACALYSQCPRQSHKQYAASASLHHDTRLTLQCCAYAATTTTALHSIRLTAQQQ
jgi:hypothetical protein